MNPTFLLKKQTFLVTLPELCAAKDDDEDSDATTSSKNKEETPIKGKQLSSGAHRIPTIKTFLFSSPTGWLSSLLCYNNKYSHSPTAAAQSWKEDEGTLWFSSSASNSESQFVHCKRIISAKYEVAPLLKHPLSTSQHPRQSPKRQTDKMHFQIFPKATEITATMHPLHCLENDSTDISS